MPLSMYKKVLFLLLLIGIPIGCYFATNVLAPHLYDATHANPYIQSADELKALLNDLASIKKEDIPKDYLIYSQMHLSKYKKAVSNLQFYLITKKETYQKIVGNIRIRDVMARDHYFYKSHYFSKDTLIWGIDSDILFTLLKLQDQLTKKGHDRDAFWVRYGHRHPQLNDEV